MPRSSFSRFAAIATAALLAVPAAAAASPPPAPTASADRPTFIVTLRPGADAASVAAEFGDRGAAVSHVYRNAIIGFAGRMGPELAEQVRRDGRVAHVERDIDVRHTGTQSSPTWGLDRVDQRLLPLDKSYSYDATAAGVTVYVVDTGVRATHVDFGGRVAGGYTAFADGNGTNDCHGHGTHVAGTSAGATYGVAKATTIVPVRVLDCNGSGSLSGIIAGLDWIIAHHGTGAAVANLSLGSTANDTFDTAIRKTVTDGVTVVAAAGNNTADACTKSPARVAEALTVAATTSSDARSSFSNFGTCVDLFAPGSSITSTYHSSDTATATMSGTSMAAPHVAGIAALHLAAAPTALPAAVHDAVNAGATTDVVTDVVGSPNRLAHSRVTTLSTSPVAPTATSPAAPAAPTATAGKRSVSLAWTAPGDGGSAITSYTVRIHNATTQTVVKTVTVSGTTTKASIGGLSGGVSYYGTVRATNAIGSSAWSAQSNTVTARR